MNLAKKIDKIRQDYFEDINPKTFDLEKRKLRIPKKLKGVEMKNLTWKSVIVLVVVTIAKFVLAQWFDEPTAAQIVEALQNVLNALFGLSVAGAVWGIKRKMVE